MSKGNVWNFYKADPSPEMLGSPRGGTPVREIKEFLGKALLPTNLWSQELSGRTKTGRVEGCEVLGELHCHQRSRRPVRSFRAGEGPCRGPVHYHQSNGDEHKEQNKQRNVLGFGLPLLGKEGFCCGDGMASLCVLVTTSLMGLGVMMSGFLPRAFSSLLYELIWSCGFACSQNMGGMAE